MTIATGLWVLLAATPGFATTTNSGLLPYLGRISPTSAVLNVLPWNDGKCYAAYRPEEAKATGSWFQTQIRPAQAGRPIRWQLSGLVPGRSYQYRLWHQKEGDSAFKADKTYTFRTQPMAPVPVAFALISDAHISPGHPKRLRILQQISDSIKRRDPDFVVMLGDNIQTFDSHGGPMGKASHGPLLYSMYRKGLGELPAGRSCFSVIGNWEGENGWHPSIQRSWAQAARSLYIPNPTSATYPQGGSDNGDYYAFAWGNLLGVVLNVSGYTPDDHGHGSKLGRHDSWTLGEKQKSWLLQTLQASREGLKVIFIHHPVGGGSPDDLNARYGRGGGLAASVGEQAELHQWMRDFGVQVLFYGHDHVFTHQVVDEIHYVCVGSAGAPWKFTTTETGYKRFWTPSGYTWVQTAEDSMTVSYLDASGKVLSSFDIAANATGLKNHER